MTNAEPSSPDFDPCPVCQSLAPKPSALWQVAKNGNGKVILDHHRSASDLERSADHGCHLCSLLCSVLTATKAKGTLPTDAQVCLAFWRDRSIDFFTDDQRDEFRLDVHIGDQMLGRLSCEPFEPQDDWQPLFEAARPSLKDTSTGSAASFHRMRIWMSNCEKFHAGCPKRRHGSNIFPARVIDVGDKMSTSSKLKEGAGLCGHYATLSHCWGKHRPLTTEEVTITHRQHGIADDEMPRTFRDAVIICRELEIRYLWIDSLCIIQDSHEDWDRNAPTMGDVYSNSILTIAASGAMDSTEGCFHLRNGLTVWCWLGTIFSLPSRVTWHPGVFEEVFGDLRDFEDRILDQRAWILQEQVLAPRTLSMGRTEMSWTCLGLSGSERHALGAPSTPGIVMDYRRLLRHVITSQDLVPSISRHQVYGLWYRTVMDFTSRKLTYRKDKLAAVSGLANRFGVALQDQYTAGLWKKDNFVGLLWKSGADLAGVSATARASDRLAPSWSWASLDGFVDYQHVVPSLDMPECITVSSLVGQPDFVLSSMSAARPFGASIECLLELDGSHFPVYLRGKTMTTLDGLKIAKFWPDDTEKVHEEAVCIPLCVVHKADTQEELQVEREHWNQTTIHREDGHPGSSFVWCLVVDPVDSEVDTFTRIGLSLIEHEQSFEIVLQARQAEHKRIALM